MILIERRLEADNLEATISIKKLSAVEVQVSITDSTGFVEWQRNTYDGSEALDMYYHPWYYGYKGGGKLAYNFDRSEAATVS